MADTYIALLRKEADSDFGVEFPDLPGCITAGTSLDDAAAMAREALDFHLDGLAAAGRPRPKPSALADILATAESSGALPVLVPAAKAKGRATRVSVTIEENLLAEIDAEAGPGGRSGFLARAAQSALGAARASDSFERQHLFDNVEEMQRRINAFLGNNDLTAQPHKPAKGRAAKSRKNPARKGRVKA